MRIRWTLKSEQKVLEEAIIIFVRLDGKEQEKWEKKEKKNRNGKNEELGKKNRPIQVKEYKLQ